MERGVQCSHAMAGGPCVGNTCAGDRIGSINGKKQVKEMCEELRTATRISVNIMRYPNEFWFEIGVDNSKNQKGLGCRLEHLSNELLIVEVYEQGAIPTFNRRMVQQRQFHMVISAGMHIVKVGDVSGDAKRLKKALKGSGEMAIHVRRAQDTSCSSQSASGQDEFEESEQGRAHKAFIHVMQELAYLRDSIGICCIERMK
ncbi:unnamed protein product [Symbiodinium sp. CCMP2592]|nr:unnamed protein product [Symbiodinium sp. CCMP2592]